MANTNERVQPVNSSNLRRSIGVLSSVVCLGFRLPFRV